MIWDEAFMPPVVAAIKPPRKSNGNVAMVGEDGKVVDDNKDDGLSGSAEEGDVPLTGPLLTQDERTCIGVCTTNAVPGTPGAPDPPQEAALGQPDYGPGVVVDEGGEDKEEE